MERKCMSLLMVVIYTVLCIMFAVPTTFAATKVVEFSDDFESESDGDKPIKWDEDTNKTATMAIVSEVGNKFARITRTSALTTPLPTIATKDNLVNVPLWQTKPIIVEARIRTNAFLSRKSLRLGYPKGTYDDYGSNKYALFMTRDGATTPAVYYLNGNTFIDADKKEQTVVSKYASKTLAANVWYDIKAVINPVTRQIKYSLKDDTMTEAVEFTGLMRSEEFQNMKSITNITFKWVTPAAETMDVDNIKLYYGNDTSVIREFSDNFDNETIDTMPSQWDSDTGGTATMTIAEENGNKYARITRTSTASTPLPTIATKDNLVNMPMWQSRPIITEARIRTSAFASRKSIRLGYPKGTYNDYGSNKYALFMMRDTANPAFYYLNGKTIDTFGREQTVFNKYGQTLASNVWYDIKIVIDPITKKVTYSLKDDNMANPIVFTGLVSSEEFDSMVSITNMTFKWATPAAETMDVDNLRLYYGEEPPVVESFTDDFQDETLNTAPSKWDADRNKVATVTVLDEGGNKFARIDKPTTKTGVPIVATKDGMINFPLYSQGKNVIVEAKIRPNTPTANRSMLRLGFPKDPNYANYGANKHTIFYMNTTKTFQFLNGTYGDQPVYVIDSKLSAEPTWYSYKAIIDTDNEKISHYIDGNLIYAQQAFTAEEFENMSNLTNLTFTWRMDGNLSGAASMDFDDVKVYTDSSFVGDVQYKQGSARLVNLENGTVTAEALVKNNADAKTISVMSALYEKQDSNYVLMDVKTKLNQPLAEFETACYTLTGHEVIDAENQIIKTFIWDNAQKPLISEVNLKSSVIKGALYINPD